MRKLLNEVNPRTGLRLEPKGEREKGRRLDRGVIRGDENLPLGFVLTKRKIDTDTIRTLLPIQNCLEYDRSRVNVDDALHPPQKEVGARVLMVFERLLDQVVQVL